MFCYAFFIFCRFLSNILIQFLLTSTVCVLWFVCVCILNIIKAYKLPLPLGLNLIGTTFYQSNKALSGIEKYLKQYFQTRSAPSWWFWIVNSLFFPISIKNKK